MTLFFCLCVSPEIDWQPVWGAPPRLTQCTLEESPASHNPEQDKHYRKWMDGWMNTSSYHSQSFKLR